mmetsp:Transcript_23960/g.50952  ORF Transcript_23960/g.50952 Transcript_23960/m.50952 type:complete len:275 (+) Transcript_23960:189-1013(+)
MLLLLLLRCIPGICSSLGKCFNAPMLREFTPVLFNITFDDGESSDNLDGMDDRLGRAFSPCGCIDALLSCPFFLGVVAGDNEADIRGDNLDGIDDRLGCLFWSPVLLLLLLLLWKATPLSYPSSTNSAARLMISLDLLRLSLLPEPKESSESQKDSTESTSSFPSWSYSSPKEECWDEVDKVPRDLLLASLFLFPQRQSAKLTEGIPGGVAFAKGIPPPPMSSLLNPVDMISTAWFETTLIGDFGDESSHLLSFIVGLEALLEVIFCLFPLNSV